MNEDMRTTPCGVRKGAWSEEEDLLLRNCVAKYGEGKWHQVPTRAGLNRCRKSCRLRWVNYLKPDIKRGDFNSDEVDLIVRLHNLLGNRWSLIAGRLPGRTANDVKNYWNTHLLKKMLACRPRMEQKDGKPANLLNVDKARKPTTSSTVSAVKPGPRVFSKNSGRKIEGKTVNGTEAPRTIMEETCAMNSTPPPPPTWVQTEHDCRNTNTQYWWEWDNLFLNPEREGTTWLSFCGGSGTELENSMESLSPARLFNYQQQGPGPQGDTSGDCTQDLAHFGSHFSACEYEY